LNSCLSLISAGIIDVYHYAMLGKVQIFPFPSFFLRYIHCTWGIHCDDSE
jgi:hypothetical protein